MGGGGNLVRCVLQSYAMIFLLSEMVKLNLKRESLVSSRFQ